MKSEPVSIMDGFQASDNGEVRECTGGKPARPQSGLPGAVVMNMCYTGLGIARSLGEHGVPVTGLSAMRGIYGNFTRYAKIRRCPDSKHDPKGLLDYMLDLGTRADHKQIIFPTRDHDLVFLDRFRSELKPYFAVMIPSPQCLRACLDKWETYRFARRANVPAPGCWKIESLENLEATIGGDLRFPCVLKPLAAYHWRGSETWNRVGERKAICVQSAGELRREYATVSSAEPRALIQEFVPGSDDQLFVAACYLDDHSTLRAGFTAQKLVQVPEGFGTGCIIQAVNRPDLLATAVRLLQEIRFTGIAEVEFKWDARSGEYLLIEVNPRPWDQHRLGLASGTDVIWHAYCTAAGLPGAPARGKYEDCRWVADDVLLLAVLRAVWRRNGNAKQLWRATRGRRMYGIWQWNDPLPFFTGLGAAVWSLTRALAKRAASGSVVPISRRFLGKDVS
jgi:D-aspartate ligase